MVVEWRQPRVEGVSRQHMEDILEAEPSLEALDKLAHCMNNMLPLGRDASSLGRHNQHHHVAPSDYP